MRRPLHVTLVFEPPVGGVPAHVQHLAHGLSARGRQVTVVGPLDEDAIASLGDAGIATVRLELARWASLRDLRSLRILRFLARVQPAIVHAHATKAGILTSLLARRYGVATVYTPHSWASQRANSALSRFALTVVDRRAARNHDAIVAVAESDRRTALGLGLVDDANRIEVHPNGIPADWVRRDRALARKRLGLAPEGMLAGWIGRNAKQKRPQDLPRLAERLAAEGITLVALGTNLATSPLNDAVRAAGGIVLSDSSSPSDLYSASDVFVSTSAWEGHPLTVIEAMRAGLPVVSYAAGGIVEQVDEGSTGYLVPVAALEELAAHVVVVAHDAGLRDRIGRAARDRFLARFTLERMLDRIDDLYERVADRRRLSAVTANG